MNQEVNNKIKLISEMLSIYQNTVLKEKDLENLKLIKKDIDNKKIELEEIKRNLDNELNTLYENGANEIDSEINQLQIVINEVDELLEEIVPDILLYIKLPNKQKDNVVQTGKDEENTKATIHINNAKNEKNLENNNKTEMEKEVKKDEFKVIPINEDLIEKKEDSFIFEEILEEELYIAPRMEVAKNIIKSKIPHQNSDDKSSVYFDGFNEHESEKVEKLNTITIRKPADNYRNVASNIVSNRLKNFDSPENAIQKAHNAAESVMNSIIENWKNNNN